MHLILEAEFGDEHSVNSLHKSINFSWINLQRKNFFWVFLFHGHCIKNVQIRSFFWSLFSWVQTEYRKIRTRKTSYLDTFHAVGPETLLANRLRYERHRKSTYIFEDQWIKAWRVSYIWPKNFFIFLVHYNLQVMYIDIFSDSRFGW